MLRVDRLSKAFKEAVSVDEYKGYLLLIVADDGSAIVSSDDSDETHTIGAAAASVFLEYKATEKFSGSALKSFKYSSKKRRVICRHFAVLEDHGSILLVAAGPSTDNLSKLTELMDRASEDLSFLEPVFAQMSRRVED